MIISIDYDDTYTVDPDFWNEVIMSAQRRGHEVVVVTARPDNDETRCEMRGVFDMWEVAIHCSGDEPKADYARRNGLAVDLWIDEDGDLGVMKPEARMSIVIRGSDIQKIVAWLGGPSLTDAEREAVEIVLRMCGDPSPVTAPLVCKYAATLRGLLERAKPVEK